MSLRVLVVDDELLARKRLLRLLSGMPEVEVVGEAEDGETAAAMLAEEPVDVVLLDIQMPGISGLELSALLDEDAGSVVFCTAHPEHALDAFGVGAADYLLKPVDAGRLREALDRVRKRREAPVAGDGSVGRLALPTRRGVRLVDRSALRSAVFDGTILRVQLAEENLLVDWTLRHLEDCLGGGPFLRVHRRALVNLDRVDVLENLETGGYLAHLDVGKPVQVSRQVARELRRRLGLR